MADTGICVVWSLQTEAADHEEQPRFLCLFPDQDLEEALWDAIEEQNLQAALQAEFPITRPLWYGLWIDSPLSQRQSAVLYMLLSDVARQSILYRRELRPFLAALRQASKGQGPLNVRLSAPGHTDFGISTKFAHCPRCKAEAPFPRWQGYPSDPIICPVCKYEYSPAATYASREDKMDSGEGEKPKRWQQGIIFFCLLIGWIIIRDLCINQSLDAIARSRRRRRRAKREKRRG